MPLINFFFFCEICEHIYSHMGKHVKTQEDTWRHVKTHEQFEGGTMIMMKRAGIRKDGMSKLARTQSIRGGCTPFNQLGIDINVGIIRIIFWSRCCLKSICDTLGSI